MQMVSIRTGSARNSLSNAGLFPESRSHQNIMDDSCRICDPYGHIWFGNDEQNETNTPPTAVIPKVQMFQKIYKSRNLFIKH